MVPARPRNRLKYWVTRSGFHGTDASSASENTNASSTNSTRTTRARASNESSCALKIDTVRSSSTIERTRRFFVGISSTAACGNATTVDDTVSTPPSRSRSRRRRRPHSSARRNPCRAATRIARAYSGQRDCSVASISARISAGVATNRRRVRTRRRLGPLRRVQVAPPPPTRLREHRREARRDLVHGPQREAASLMCAIEIGERLRRHLRDRHPSERRTDVLLVRLRVAVHGVRRATLALQHHDPVVEQIVDGRARARVLALGRLDEQLCVGSGRFRAAPFVRLRTSDLVSVAPPAGFEPATVGLEVAT